MAFDVHREGDFCASVGNHGLVIREEEGRKNIDLKFKFYFLESSQYETPFLGQNDDPLEVKKLYFVTLKCFYVDICRCSCT